jgi:uncharacterized membrane protein HdeD (DUF308 family)
MTTDQTPERQALNNLWWLVLLRGLVLLALGIVFLAKPVVPLTLAILVMGAYWFIDGILTVTRYIRARQIVRYWGFGVFIGAIGIIAGLVVFSRPVASALLTTTFLVYFLAFAALISGIASLTTGIRTRHESANAWTLIIGGSVSVVFGLLLISSPLYSILLLVKVLGVIALIVGLVHLGYAWRVRSVAR